jgi:hypothetical protein
VVDVVYRDGVLAPVGNLDLPPGRLVTFRLVGDAGAPAGARSRRGTGLGWAGASTPLAEPWSTSRPLTERSPHGVLVQLTRTLARQLTLRAGLLLLGGGLALYLTSRLIALTDFPIYFFTDEAIQTVLAERLLENGLRDHTGTFLPPFFQNDRKWNLGLSVYVHLVSVALFGKSVFLTRATSVFIGLLGLAAMALMLKLVFRSRFWWAAGFVLAAIPTWFLHSRTAFETVMMVAFYTCFLCAYLLYRYRSPRFLFPAILFGGATFYSYSNGQGVMLASGVMLLLSDLRHHLRVPGRYLLGGVVLLLLLSLPYVRFLNLHPDGVEAQLADLHSYWLQPISTSEKFSIYGRTYLQGLDPRYWFFPNAADLERHRMAGFGHLPAALAPLIAVGLIACLRRWSSPAHRAVLIAMLAAPFSAAFVAIGVTRVLVMVVPVVLLACVGLDQCVTWLRRPGGYLGVASISLVVLTSATYTMTRAALTDGPTWYQNYGLGGMQYGASQLFPRVAEELDRSPESRLLVSHSWANNPNVFIPFFLTDDQARRVLMTTVDAFLLSRRDLTPDMLFVMPAYEYEKARSSGKFVVQTPKRVIPYPNGEPGFYFVRLAYVDNVDALFAADRLARQQLRSGTATVDGQSVSVRHSQLDIGSLPDLFDGNTRTLIRGMEANPLVIELEFGAPRTISTIGIDLGSMDLFSVRVVLTLPARADAHEYTYTYRNLPRDPRVDLTMDGETHQASKLRLEIKHLTAGEIAHVHVRDVTLR